MSARFSCAAALLLLLPLASSASEPDDETPLDLDALRAERQEALESYVVDERTGKRIAKVLEALEVSDYATAGAQLDKINFGRLNPYEKAIAYRLRAYAAFGTEDFAAAVAAFEKVIEQEALPLDDESSIRFNVAQLYAALEQWENVTQALNDWFRYVEEPNPLAYYLLAAAYYQLGKLDLALEPARMAVELSDKPREGWLQLLAALYIGREAYDDAVRLLEQLVANFPKRQYWVQLSLIYGAQGDYENSLSVQQIAYAQGLLTEDNELQRLARSYLFRDLPYSAARVLETALAEDRIQEDEAVLELLGNSWIAAREYEKSLGPLQQAARLSEDGRLYKRLGQVHLQREEWGEAAALLQKALEKGGLEDPGAVHLLLGISLYSDGRTDPARSAFVRARDHASSRDEANAWLEHIARESQG